MKFDASIMVAAFLALSAFAGVRVVVPSLPEPLRPLAEVETNVAFSAGSVGNNLWRLSIILDATVSNSVEVVLGADADGDGALALRRQGKSTIGTKT